MKTKIALLSTLLLVSPVSLVYADLPVDTDLTGVEMVCQTPTGKTIEVVNLVKLNVLPERVYRVEILDEVLYIPVEDCIIHYPKIKPKTI